MPSRERTFRVEAVVLRHSDWGEADRLLSLYSREQGKLRAVAKGVRKVRSRKAGHLEPFTRVSLLLARGIHPKVVSERLGHASIVITLDTYSHVTPGLQEAAARRFDEGLLSRAPAPTVSS